MAAVVCIASSLASRLGSDAGAVVLKGRAVPSSTTVQVNMTVFDDYFAFLAAFGSLHVGWVQALTNNLTLLSPQGRPEFPGFKAEPEPIQEACRALYNFGSLWDEGSGSLRWGFRSLD